MKCIKCNKNASIFFPSFSSCNSCFIEIIDKRIRKEIRANSFLKSQKKMGDIFLIDDDSVQSAFIKFFFNNIGNIRIKKMKLNYKTLFREFSKNNTKVIIPLCLDDEATYFFESVLNNKKAKHIGHFKYKKAFFFKPLLHVSKKEIMLYLKLKNIPFKTNDKKNYLDALEKKIPELKFSLVKSAIEINLNT